MKGYIYGIPPADLSFKTESGHHFKLEAELFSRIIRVQSVSDLTAKYNQRDFIECVELSVHAVQFNNHRNTRLSHARQRPRAWMSGV